MSAAPRILLFVLSISCPAAAMSAETATYVYDAKGRLVQVIKSGGTNNGTTTTYDHDKADNRVRVVTNGSPR